MTQPRAESGLVRALGVWGLSASVINITIGGGIFRAPGAPEVSGRLGAAAPLSYIICAIAMAFVVLCFAEAGGRIASSGGPYAYVERAFGPTAGFAVGWMLWVTGTIATAAVATIFADSVQAMIPSLGGAAMRAGLIVLMFAVVTSINVRGVQFGAGLNLVSTVVKLVPLALLIVLGLFAAKAENLAWPGMPSAPDLTRSSIVLLFIFAGIESALVPSGEVSDPARTVPRAVLIALGVVTVVYILIHLAAQGVLGSRLPGNNAPLSDLATAVMGPAGGVIVGVAIVLSTFGYLSGMTLAIPRALFAFARDGVLPAALARVHPVFHTPRIAIITQTVLAVVLAVSSEWEKLVVLANISVLIVYFGCALAAWQLRRTGVHDEGAPGAAKIPGSAIAAPMALVVIIVLLTSVKKEEWLASAATIFVGVLFYAASPAGWLRRSGATQRA
ncbi:MAG TPA: APC family permease [Gemmatimonadaceae bacterium]